MVPGGEGRGSPRCAPVGGVHHPHHHAGIVGAGGSLCGGGRVVLRLVRHVLRRVGGLVETGLGRHVVPVRARAAVLRVVLWHHHLLGHAAVHRHLARALRVRAWIAFGESAVGRAHVVPVGMVGWGGAVGVVDVVVGVVGARGHAVVGVPRVPVRVVLGTAHVHVAASTGRRRWRRGHCTCSAC